METTEKCIHEWDDGVKDTSPYSNGFGIIAFHYTCVKCGTTMTIEKDIL